MVALSSGRVLEGAERPDLPGPALDATGTHIAFASLATNLVDPDQDPDSNGKAHIYLHHLESGLELEERMHRMSANVEGTHGNDHSMNPDIGLGGRAVVYQSVATNFLEDQDPPSTVSSDTNGVQDVFETRLRAPFNRGDADGMGSFEVTDASFINNWLFLSGPKPPCVDAADVDDTGEIEITDAVYVTNWLFEGGPAPPDPNSGDFSSCGFDPTDDSVTCKTRPSYCTEGHSHSM